jgi:hypothetical protein
MYARIVRRSAFGVRRSAFGVRRSPFGVRRSFVVGRSLVVRRWFVVRRDVDLAQAVLPHHDLVDRQRVEELVGDQDAFVRIRQGRTGPRQPIGDVAQGLNLRCARRGARFYQVQADRFVESGVVPLRRAKDVGR